MQTSNKFLAADLYAEGIFPVSLFGAEDLAYYSFWFSQDIIREIRYGLHLPWLPLQCFLNETELLARAKV